MEIQFGIKNGWGSQNYNIMGVATGPSVDPSRKPKPVSGGRSRR